MEGNCLVLVGKVHCIELPFKNVFLLKVAHSSVAEQEYHELTEMWNLFLHVFLGRKITKLPGTMAHTCYPSTWEVDEGGLGS